MKTISFKTFNSIAIATIALMLAVTFSISFSSCKKESKEKADTLCPVVTASEVPQVVKDSFAVRYPATSVTTWFNKDSVAFCAFFTISGIEKLAQFANNGSFIKDEIETNQEGEHQDSTGTGGKTTGCECETHTEGD